MTTNQNPQKPNILITNDDGIHAPGIRHLWNALSSFANVTVVAPVSEKSGSGLSMTLTKPLLIQKIKWAQGNLAKTGKSAHAFRVNNGTPADCVKLALNRVLKQKPDLIVSGINHGSNSGRSIFYSGTVGAIIEGAFRNIAGIAFSCLNRELAALEAAEKYVAPIVKYILENPLEKGSFLNVNFPFSEKIKGFKMARQGLGYWLDHPVERTHPEGHNYYWLGCKFCPGESENVQSDVNLLEEGYITAVPINLNEVTDLKHLEKERDNFEKTLNTSIMSSGEDLEKVL